MWWGGLSPEISGTRSLLLNISRLLLSLSVLFSPCDRRQQSSSLPVQSKRDRYEVESALHHHYTLKILFTHARLRWMHMRTRAKSNVTQTLTHSLHCKANWLSDILQELLWGMHFVKVVATLYVRGEKKTCVTVTLSAVCQRVQRHNLMFKTCFDKTLHGRCNIQGLTAALIVQVLAQVNIFLLFQRCHHEF